MRKNELLKQIVLLLSVMACFIMPVYANSALTFWSGTTGSGAVTQDGDCPVVVTHETLTYDLGGRPVPGKIDLAHYDNSFTAEYTFRNPSDLEVHTLLSFPLGTSPYYLSSSEIYDDSLYEILINGEPARTTVRYTYKPQGNIFSLEKDLELLSDEYRKDAFYSPDLKVTECTYHIKADGSGFNEGTNLIFSAVYPNNPARTRILCLDDYGWHETSVETAAVRRIFTDETEITLYCLGESAEPVFEFYADTGKQEEELNGEAELIMKEEMTYLEFVRKLPDIPEDINDIDYYNAVTDMFEYFSGYSSILEYNMISGNLLKWLQYELDFEPGETLTNTVKAPAFPAIDMDYDPVMFIYNYLLSPASLWKEFGDLDIIINTDLFLYREPFGTFEKTGSGYHAHFDSLPDQELSFMLNESESPKSETDYVELIFSAILIIVPLTGIILFVWMVIAVVKLLIRRKKEKDEI